MATEPLVTPSGCYCLEWRDNIEKVNAPIVLQTLRSGGSWQYDGKPFVFCPWCGTCLPPTVSEQRFINSGE